MTEFPDDADGDVLRGLADSGVDLSQPRSIDFMIDAPNGAAAELILAEVRSQGYEAEIEYDEGEPMEEGDCEEEFGPAWTVYVATTMPPAYDAIVRIQDELGAIAEPHGGRADGWGTMVD